MFRFDADVVSNSGGRGGSTEPVSSGAWVRKESDALTSTSNGQGLMSVPTVFEYIVEVTAQS